MGTLDDIKGKTIKPTVDDGGSAGEPQNTGAQQNNNGGVGQQTAAPKVTVPNVQPTVQPAANAAGTVAGQQQAPGMSANEQLKVAPTVNNYQELLQQLGMQKPRSQEEIEADKKREKREKMFASIGDGISALANLYFTTKGSPNAYYPKQSMYAQTQERWDKYNKEMRENVKDYVPTYMRMQQYGDERADKERAWNRQLERDKVADERYADETAYIRGEDDKNRQERQEAREYQQKKDEQQQENWQKTFDAQQKQNDRQNALAWARVNQVTTGGRGGGKANTANEYVMDDGSVVTVPTARGNVVNIGKVFEKLPDEVKKKAGKPRYNRQTGRPETRTNADGTYEEVYDEPTQEEMLRAIGRNISKYPEVQKALRQIGGNYSAAQPQNTGAQQQNNGGGAKHDYSTPAGGSSGKPKNTGGNNNKKKDI